MTRYFVVLDVKDDAYEGGKEDVAIWIEQRLGQDRSVEATVYQSIEAMKADRDDGLGAWG